MSPSKLSIVDIESPKSTDFQDDDRSLAETHSSEFDSDDDKEDNASRDSSSGLLRSRKLFLLFFLAIAIALAVGLGVGLSLNPKSSVETHDHSESSGASTIVSPPPQDELQHVSDETEPQEEPVVVDTSIPEVMNSTVVVAPENGSSQPEDSAGDGDDVVSLSTQDPMQTNITKPPVTVMHGPPNLSWPELQGMPGEDAKQWLLDTYGDTYYVQIVEYGQPTTKDLRSDRIFLFLDQEGFVMYVPRVG